MKVGVTANEQGSSTKSILTLTHTSTHARTHACARLHTIAQSRTHVCANACMHAHIPSYIQTDRRHVLIHTYIYNVHFRQTDKYMVDESCYQTDGIHTYIHTYIHKYVRTYVHTCTLSVSLHVCLSVRLSVY